MVWDWKCHGKVSKQEFCLVINLSFGTLSSIFNKEYVSVVGEIHDWYFKLEHEISKKTLWNKFNKGKFEQEKNVIKMALVAFVKYIILAKII